MSIALTARLAMLNCFEGRGINAIFATKSVDKNQMRKELYGEQKKQRQSI